MITLFENLINTAYTAFNARQINKVLTTFHPNVQWPKAFEGGHVKGHDAVREYWTKQWSEINPNVQPLEFVQRPIGTFEVLVHQIVHDLDGNIIFDGNLKHIYSLKDNLLQKTDVEID